MSLREYRKKRDFSKTKEPNASRSRVRAQRFVVQKHAATRLHYDFRLEIDGVLKSWAVPKGPSLDPGVKRMAVEVEDHPVSYGNFEGEIPQGEYGGGEVIVWDHGEWVPPKNARQALQSGRLEFELRGEKLSGRWILVRTGKPAPRKKSNWLLIKRSDEWARPGDEDFVETRPESVLSGRRLRIDDRASSAPVPKFIEPQLASLVEKPPRGENWIHEIKFDGYRTLCRIENGKARFFTRNGYDWTEKYHPLLASFRKLKVRNAFFDGEVVWVGEDGKTRFQDLQESLKSGDLSHVAYYAFDLLHLNGRDLRDQPLTERKRVLKNLLDSNPSERIRFSEHWNAEGPRVLKASCGLKLEGIISKRADRPYESGRSGDWVKSKCLSTQEFVVGGYSAPGGSRNGFGSLLLGAYTSEGEFKYAGRVGTGFSTNLISSITRQLRKIATEKSPFDLRSPKGRGLNWVRPQLVVQVEFTEWTKDGVLRHPSFQGLREDKPAKDVGFDALPPRAKPSPPKSRFRLTHPEKILFPATGLTKERVATYYETIAPWILPHLKGRPLSLFRCPDGQGRDCFFQKHLRNEPHQGLEATVIKSRAKGGTEEILFVEGKEGLTQLVQMNALELHIWGSRRTDIDKADQIVLDLDPDPGVKWNDVREAAFELRELLERLNLKSFVKATGGKGLHVQIPICPIYPWAEVKAFSKAVAAQLAKESPTKYTTHLLKVKRKGRIFLDYLRNGYGATAVAAYSLRAKPNAPVALPVSWEHLKTLEAPDVFSLENAEKILRRRRKDPWAGYTSLQQRIAVLEQKSKRRA